MAEIDVFEKNLSNFLLENNFSNVQSSNYKTLNLTITDILLRVNYNNYKIKKFLLDYIEEKIDFNLLFEENGEDLLNAKILKSIFEKSSIQQLMMFIENKLHLLYMSEKYPILKFDQLLSFYPNAEDLQVKNSFISFNLPEKWLFIEYKSKIQKNKNKIKKDEKQIKKFWVCSEQNFIKFTEELTIREIYTKGYFYVYENIHPLENCIYFSDWIGNIFTQYNVLNLEYFGSDKNYFENYVLNKITKSGVFSYDKVWMPFECFKENLKIKNIIEIDNFEKLFRKTKNKIPVLDNAIFFKNYKAVKIMLKYLPVTNLLIENAILDEKLSELIEDKSLLQFPHRWGSEQANCKIVKLKCSEEKEVELIEIFTEIEFDQEDYFTFIRPLERGTCDNNNFYLIAYTEIDDRILLCGSLNCTVIGNIYYVSFLGTQTIKNDIVKGIGSCLIKTLEDDAKNNSIDKIVLYSIPEAESFYFKMGFELNSAGLMTKDVVF